MNISLTLLCPLDSTLAIGMTILLDFEAHTHDCEHLSWSQMLTHRFPPVSKPNPFA